MIKKIELEVNDRNDLINLLIDIPELGTEIKRRQILESAGLDNFYKKIDLSGDLKTVVGQIVNTLSNYGYLDENKTALGLLLRTVKNVTGYQQQVFIDQLLNKYQLLIEYQKELTGISSSNVSNATFDKAKVRIDYSKRLDELLNPHNFDLQQLTEDCLERILENNGLIGLAMRYNEFPFPEYFCKRLKNKLGKRSIEIKVTTLAPEYNSVEGVVEIINKNRQILQNRDIIFRITVNCNSSIVEKFWREIYSQFNGNCKHRLILLMFGNKESCFPDGVTTLNPPQFKKSHIHEWVLEVTRVKEWTEEVQDQWKEKMINLCLSQNNPESKLLDVKNVYSYLNMCIQLLQENSSAEDFLNAFN